MNNSQFIRCSRCFTPNRIPSTFCGNCRLQFGSRPQIYAAKPREPEKSWFKRHLLLFVILGSLSPLILLIGTAFIIGIVTAINQDGRPQQSLVTETLSQRPITKVSQIDATLAIPVSFKPVYKIIATKDVNTSNSKRKMINISLPNGLNQQTIEMNMRQAVKDLYEKEKPDAIMVYGYKTGEIGNTPYTIAMLTFAPDGDWSKASDKSALVNFKAVFNIREDYLADKKRADEKKATVEKIENAKLDAERRKSDREEMAHKIETTMLSEGYDFEVYISGADKTVLTLKYVLMSRPIIYKVTQETKFLSNMREAGFKKVIFTDGYDSTWTYNL